VINSIRSLHLFDKLTKEFTMNKLAISIALAAMSLAAHAQSAEAPTTSDHVAAAAVSRFVDHPYNCKQMLGGSDDGDQLPSSYSAALDASLKEINTPVDQALTRIKASCAQRVNVLNWERVSKLN
jgi:hypothetical protein